jgi:hypothetical protein
MYCVAERQKPVCGICGVYKVPSGESVQRGLVERMADLISHHVPDEGGVYLDGPVGLSIIDLSGGYQPISNETGEIWVVFNGDIWNYKTLPQELTEKGHRFCMNSDTETIVHPYFALLIPMSLAMFFLYQGLLSFDALRAVYRYIRCTTNWEKTSHLGQHRAFSEAV